MRLSGKEAVVLQLLLGDAPNERYALGLVEESKGRLGRGTVYVTLARMEEKAYVESRQEIQVHWPGHPRRLYRPTPLGRRAFEAWEMARAHLEGAFR